jgi:hypothetical protein
MEMTAPQIVMIVLYAMSTGISIAQHGKAKTGKHNFFVHIVGVAIGASILYWGGFWN